MTHPTHRALTPSLRYSRLVVYFGDPPVNVKQMQGCPECRRQERLLEDAAKSFYGAAQYVVAQIRALSDADKSITNILNALDAELDEGLHKMGDALIALRKHRREHS
jgi:hypothetical protein